MTKDRRKSGNTTTTTTTTTKSAPIRRSTTPEKTSSRVVTVKVDPRKLRAIIDPASLKKEDTPVKEDVKESPATSTTIPAPSNAENASDSNPATPAASGTPAPQPMGPPADGPKKKGIKRSAGAATNGEPKARGKPGPKKKQRLDDGTVVEGGKANGVGAAHKLGPKANQGAINAGLRALDRSGKPCRRWTKGGFTLKSFTGTVWEVPRWTAPPKLKPEGTSAEDSTTVSAEGSTKENKENGVEKIANDSNLGGDVEMQSLPSVAAANSPAPFAIAAA